MHKQIMIFWFLWLAVAHTCNIAVIDTSLGVMKIELFAQIAPKTVANFKDLIGKKWYEGKTFYRVVKGRVIQAGSNDEHEPLTKKATVTLEHSDLKHIKGVVGLARDEKPDSGSTEFYICHETRSDFDGNFAIFGQVIDGFDTLENIARVDVNEAWVGPDKTIPFHSPKKPIVINSIHLMSNSD